MRMVYDAGWFWSVAQELTDVALVFGRPGMPFRRDEWTDWLEAVQKEDLVGVDRDAAFDPEVDAIAAFWVARYLWGLDVTVTDVFNGSKVLVEVSS